MLERFKQVAIQIEAQEGVHEAGEASTDLLTIKDLKWKPDFERYEPDTAQLSLTPTPDRQSRTSGELSFTVELAGAAAGLTASPPFAALMRACGFRMYGETTVATTPFGGSSNKGRVFYVVADADWTTGTTLENGTVVTDGASGDAIVLGTYVEGTGTQRIYLLNTDASGADFASDGTITATGIAIDYTGAPVQAGRAFLPADKPTYFLRGTLAGTIAAGDIVTGITSGAKALVTQAFASGASILVERAPGFGFFAAGETVRVSAGNEITSIQAPVQFDIPTLSATYYEDGNRVRLAGCRGSAVIKWENGKPGLMEVTLRGLHDSEATTAMFPTAAPLEATPPTFFGAQFTFDQTLHPLISMFSVDLGRETARRSDVEKANGYGFTASVDRKIVGSVDPEALHESIYASIGKSRQAVGIRIDGSYGTAGTGNAFEFNGPNVQFTLEPSARDKQSVYEKSLKFFGKAGVRGDEFCLFTR